MPSLRKIHTRRNAAGCLVAKVLDCSDSFRKSKILEGGVLHYFPIQSQLLLPFLLTFWFYLDDLLLGIHCSGWSTFLMIFSW